MKYLKNLILFLIIDFFNSRFLVYYFTFLFIFFNNCITVSRDEVVSQNYTNFRVNHSCKDQSEKHADFTTCLYNYNTSILEKRKRTIENAYNQLNKRKEPDHFNAIYLLSRAEELQKTDPKKSYGLCIYIYNKTKDISEKEKALLLASNSLSILAEESLREGIKKINGDLK